MSKKEELFGNKLKAYFHDSPDKPFILLTGESHEQRAQEISEKMGIPYDKTIASDILASSMERYYVPKDASKNKNLQVIFEEYPEFVHPLAANRFNNFAVKKEIFKKAVDDAVEELSKMNFKDNYEKFVYLWRYLEEILKKHTPAEYKKFWDLAPADTRFPNHTIFEHLKLASAVNAYFYNNISLNKMTLFLFTIGPVQEYIGQARKTQDLYWGSYILSYLTWIAIEKVIEIYGPDCIIFPELKKQPLCDFWIAKFFDNNPIINQNLKTPTIPNRFFAILPTKNVEEIRALELKKIVQDEFAKIGEYIFTHIVKGNDEQKKNFLNQLSTFPDVYWVALPLESGDGNKADWEIQLDKIKDYFSSDDIEEMKELLNFIKGQGEYEPNIGNIYGLLYSFMEKMFGARKGVRNFSQYEEEGRKCSVCGEYNVFIYRSTREEEENIKKGKESYKIKLLKKQNAIIKVSEDKSIPYKYLAQGEGLCSKCFTKRAAEIYFKEVFGDKNTEESFPSTAEIALMDIINNADNKLKTTIKEYEEAFKNWCGDNFDYELLYEENLNENYFETYGFNIKKLQELKKLLQNIDDRIKNLKLNKKKYYAVIKLDGDDMGKWLAGELAPYMLEMYHSKLQGFLPENFKKNIKDKKRLMTPAIHSLISEALRNYSLKYVKEIIEGEEAGKVIYSGGDDVFAIVNLNYLLDVMVKLRAAFSGHLIVNEKLIPDFTIDAGFIERKDEIDLMMGNRPTASMGVVIAHYKEDLKDVIASVNEVEEEYAKKVEGKDAFAIKLILRSGENYIAMAKWNYVGINNREGIIGLLKDINSFFKEGKISISFVGKLKAALEKIDIDSLPQGVFTSELKRSIKRSLNTELSKEEKEKVEREFFSLLGSLYKEVKYENFIGFLTILAFLNRGGE
ncbi:MAG: CRISPR-associated protein, Crm2 family [Caldanaerobacter subterraneus]|uniref:type III-B CRISPR-associated protein Cas10/Cmr2 n=1 Tax=Thermoanaerobacter sp. RKWS2 TaxID=2983842 RepID=UPI00074652C1|nr:type III-B CRISPR-associated protein Cas10/Cmr2 [Thermoanaerobacter sp. RKWS2]KUJ90112.1 MAG: Crm2 family CRISPR-associated protein [Thermoanaerobacter thermocopriae]KUK35579.1 MAG: CRISPR-associated protein, Crm2 family [Caldanaerobacter subterraneus]HAA81140.1 type III-B CRISPR-associated protein Cas10/Cmr2 [Thermoanaerobacter sp.]UZQ83701.1 type III-B CRISPR-associated protein Cas10/Cmr2 [Thermoanaerobacter sp. RKWS2]HCD10506.1 type III-B CRISPR-associated protein Cas10/Cmr2 [Thermoanaer